MNAYQRLLEGAKGYDGTHEEALYDAFRAYRSDFGPDIGPEKDWEGYYLSHDRSCRLWENRYFGIARLEGIPLAREIYLAAGA
jgi:hypothetical protein